MIRRKLIAIRDETLRDGAQQPGIKLASKDRIEIALLSARLLGCSTQYPRNQIDLGMPEASSQLFNCIDATARELKRFPGIDLFVTGRATQDAIEAMHDSLKLVPKQKRIIAPFLGISQKHRNNLGLTKEDVFKKIRRAIKYAHKFGSRIHFPLEGGYFAYLEEPEYVYRIFSLLSDLKVESVPFCDTVGTALPFPLSSRFSYGRAIRDLRRRFPEVSISVHCHDDFGLAVANTLDGLLNGAEVADGTFFGIGERAGNTALQTLLVVLTERIDQLALQIQVNLKQLHYVSNKIQEILRLQIPDNYPVVGVNSFSHASGIHQDGTIKDRETYEPFKPTKTGRRGHRIVLSILSGKQGIDYILRRKFHIFLSKKRLNLVVNQFRELETYETTPEQELLKLVGQTVGRHASSH